MVDCEWLLSDGWSHVPETGVDGAGVLPRNGQMKLQGRHVRVRRRTWNSLAPPAALREAPTCRRAAETDDPLARNSI